MRVPVVEDERDLAGPVAVGPRRHAMAVGVAYDGAAAVARPAVHDYDVLVLDRDLPEMHGDPVCREPVMRGSRTRTLLTAAASVPKRVAGLFPVVELAVELLKGKNWSEAPVRNGIGRLL
nr:hypothetical protein GCM10020093_044120 [Planobispora longispora]